MQSDVANDQTGNGYTLTNAGASSVSNSDGYANFDGTSWLQNDTLGTVGNTITVAFWFKGSTLPTTVHSGLVSQAYSVPGTIAADFSTGLDDVGTSFSYNGTIVWGPIITDGNPHLVVVSYDYTGGNALTIQIDNGTVSSAGPGYNARFSDHLFIGAFDGINGDGLLVGQINRVGIWSRILSSTEITALYNSGSGKSYSGL